MVPIWDLLIYLSLFPYDRSLDNRQRRGIACQLMPTPMEGFQSLDSLKAPIATNMESVVSTTQKAETRGLLEPMNPRLPDQHSETLSSTAKHLCSCRQNS